VAQFDETGMAVTEDFPLSEHPALRDVMCTGEAANVTLIADAAGPQVREIIRSLELTNGAYVPVRVDGEIDGVLAVAGRGQLVSAELFEYCKAVGHITELALENARSREHLEAQATTDDLTGLANRRAFDQWLAMRPSRLKFCVLALDLDGLKRVNDTLGHVAGDELLVHFAHVVKTTLRRGDMLARVGGDEFAGLLLSADDQDGTQAARRMLAALESAPFRGRVFGVSIGIASGGGDASGVAVFAAADSAMYQAKRSGGHCFVVAAHVDEMTTDRASAFL
jgi:diguanylate cyclase (GGDEF)-like protein